MQALADWTGRKYSDRITIVEGKGFELDAVCLRDPLPPKQAHDSRRNPRQIRLPRVHRAA